jgi:transcriptional regulator with XRE-family HTH domain
MLTIGEKLRKLRKEKGVSLQTVADALGISKSTITGYEHDSREPGIEIINKIADYYRVNPLFLIRNDLIPNYKAVNLKELFEYEDLTVEGKRLTNREKDMIYRVIKAIVQN